MNFIPRLLSKHRCARLAAWALAMLVWMAQVLLLQTPFKPRHERQRHTRMSLDRMTRMVKELIICRAADFAQRRPRKRRILVYRGRDIRRRGLFRAALGSRVRRALKGRDAGQRILALIRALTQLDALAAIVAKSLKRGLTRRALAQFALPPAPATPVVALTANETCFADSS